MLFVGIVAADQFVKAIITASMVPGESIPVLKHVFHLTYVLNPGAAFGILPNQRVFFMIAGVLVLVPAMVIYSRIKRSDTMMRFGMISMISGAAANLIDRFQNGLVVDFLDFRIWPVFNIADIAIVLGTCFMVYSLMFKFSETTSAQE
ncbi:MAG: signal peptidase II [Selenomonadaceae bacterium]|nr:signal peptidase II [Selenomonadaceae bacterium]